MSKVVTIPFVFCRAYVILKTHDIKCHTESLCFKYYIRQYLET